MNGIDLSGARSARRRWIAALASLAAIALFASCDGGSLGDRCNPLLSHDECGAGLACTTPPTCVISVCCPTSGTSDDPNCACITNPAACACSVIDAGSPATGDDGGAEASTPADSATPVEAASSVDAADARTSADAADAMTTVDAADAMTTADAADASGE